MITGHHVGSTMVRDMEKLTDDEMIAQGQRFMEASLRHLRPESVESPTSRDTLVWFTQGVVLKVTERNVSDEERHRYAIVLRGILSSVFSWTSEQLDEAVDLIRNGKFHEWIKVVSAGSDGVAGWRNDADSESTKTLSSLVDPQAPDATESRDDSGENLVTEAHRISKLCFNLLPGTNGDSVYGVWGGSGVVAAPEGDWEHRFSVDCQWLQRNGFPLSGWMSIYESESTGEFRAFLGSDCSVSSDHDGVKLTGAEASSLPPLPALCHFGGHVVDSWLSSLGLSRQDTDAFDDPLLDEGYNEYWQDNSPLYTGGVDIVLGGWHLSWPDEHSYVDRVGKLCLTSYRGAEPWIEVWCGPESELTVISRTT